MTPGGMQGPTAGLSQQAGEAGGSLILEAQGKVGAAPTTTRRVGTARRLGLGKQGGKVQHDVNQWSNPLKRLPRLQPGGYGPASSARLPNDRVGDSAVGDSVRRSGGHEEGLRRTRGEAAGEQLGTTSANRCMVNAGTLLGSPFPPASQAGGGQARCRLLALGGDGAAVVVRGRESRPHGEGRQQVRSGGTGRPGGRR
jgi:hypothetical protein